MTDQPTPRAPERATEALRFVDEFLAVGGNGEGWTGEHLRAVVAWGLGRELDDRGLMLARGVLGSDLIDSPPPPEPTAPGEGDAKLAGNSTAPDDLQELLAAEIFSRDNPYLGHQFSSVQARLAAAAVMDVLRQRGVIP